MMISISARRGGRQAAGHSLSALRVTALAVVLAAGVAGCSGGSANGYSLDGGDGSDPGSDTGSEPTPDREPEATGGDPLLLLGDDTELLNAVPDIVDSITLADTGLQVAYTAPGQRDRIAPAYLEAQWVYMQTCTGVTAPPPLLVIVSGSVAPFVATDDVIRDIDGSTVAAASVTAAGNVVQVSDSDFDGSIGTEGFSTRTILGRMLWLGDDLAERDYPFTCARTEPFTAPG